MEVLTKSCITGAREARGTAVIIDVLRASNTIIALLAAGADHIIPTASLDDAYALKREFPDHLLLGERKRIAPPGFDGGNSPSEIVERDLRGRAAILTTSAGSQGIAATTGADRTLIGSLANANAVVGAILSSGPSVVTLAPMGFEGSLKAIEDEVCARCLTEMLGGGRPNRDEASRDVLDSDAAGRLRELGHAPDVEFASRWNTFPIVPEFNRAAGVIRASEPGR